MAFFSRKSKGPFIRVSEMTMHWDTEDPFIFVSHHEDDYPAGNRQMAPPLEEISGRNLGRDYKKIMGFRMFNGKVVPGFPMHAHWGYETVTLAHTGYVDHSDCEGTTGRYGFGDVQWVSAPGFYEHCEMYPLVNKEGRNPNDITQVMIALPPEKRNLPENSVNTVWKDEIPLISSEGCRIQLICGKYGGFEMKSPSLHSWADGSRWVRMMRIELDPGASVTIDKADPSANRNLYFVSGEKGKVLGEEVDWGTQMKISPDVEVDISNGEAPSVFWILEGVPIGCKMSMFGPVLLGSDKEVREALQTIRKEEFSRWPWEVIDRVNPAESGRFIQRKDGSRESPDVDT
jgi:redox-sensitive bicupin YhaK (pirin superfamily)